MQMKAVALTGCQQVAHREIWSKLLSLVHSVGVVSFLVVSAVMQPGSRPMMGESFFRSTWA